MHATATKRALLALVLLIIPGLGLSVGCGQSDPTYTAAPPPGPDAHPLPPVTRMYPHPKLPPLVDKSGRRAGSSIP
jgi:hypothetical protein